MKGLNRRALLGASAAALLLAKSTGARAAIAQPLPGAPVRGAYLIKGGAVITVDRAIGTLPRADVLVRDGVIEQIDVQIEAGPDIEVIQAAGMIVMPGMIDSHCHMWETINRNLLADELGYFPVKNATAPIYTPDDYYNSVMIGMLELASAGVTTVHNWSHNVQSPAHADAELRAHRDSFLRARYSYGPPNEFTDINAPLDWKDIDRVSSEWFGSPERLDGLVHFGINLPGVKGGLTQEGNYTLIEAAIDRKLPVSIHGGFEAPMMIDVLDLERHGYLGPNFLIAHLYPGELEIFQAMERHGAPLTYAPYTLAGVTGDPHTGLTRIRRAGVTASLSSDATPVGPLDMLDMMRLAWNFGTPLVGGAASGQLGIGFLETIEMATINGARALGIDKITGSLTKGKRADIAIIRTSDIGIGPMGLPETTVVMSATSANVDTVLVDGRILKRGGKLVAYDTPKVVTAAQESLLHIRQQAGNWMAPPT